jgi:hypothetical protein
VIFVVTTRFGGYYRVNNNSNDNFPNAFLEASNLAKESSKNYGKKQDVIQLDLASKMLMNHEQSVLHFLKN